RSHPPVLKIGRSVLLQEDEQATNWFLSDWRREDEFEWPAFFPFCPGEVAPLPTGGLSLTRSCRFHVVAPRLILSDRPDATEQHHQVYGEPAATIGRLPEDHPSRRSSLSAMIPTRRHLWFVVGRIPKMMIMLRDDPVIEIFESPSQPPNSIE